MPVDRETLVARAKLAEMAERYDDMTAAVKELAESEEALTVEERNLLSVAYKNVVGAARASWRVLSSMQGKETDAAKVAALDTFIGKVRGEVQAKCAELLGVVDALCKAETRADAEVFYLKMAGDYQRYLAEVGVGDDRDKAIANAGAKYEQAQKVADEKNLLPTDPIRLGLALNYSVYYYEIKQDPKRATSIAKDAFDSAISDLDKLDEEDYKDATLIMQLIRDNLSLWNADLEPEPEPEQANDGTTVEEM